jgi:hypothetical protein
MPLTAKGSEVMAKLKKEYGPESGERVFYAMKNKGTLTGVDSRGDAAEPGTPEDQTPIPADYGTKLDKAVADAEKLMTRVGCYMDRNDGQMCNIADADEDLIGKWVRFEQPTVYYKSGEAKGGKQTLRGQVKRVMPSGKLEVKSVQHGYFELSLSEIKSDSDTEAEREGIEIHGKREMVR